MIKVSILLLMSLVFLSSCSYTYTSKEVVILLRDNDSVMFFRNNPKDLIRNDSKWIREYDYTIEK